jgi:hypothetical protein
MRGFAVHHYLLQQERSRALRGFFFIGDLFDWESSRLPNRGLHQQRLRRSL